MLQKSLVPALTQSGSSLTESLWNSPSLAASTSNPFSTTESLFSLTFLTMILASAGSTSSTIVQGSLTTYSFAQAKLLFPSLPPTFGKGRGRAADRPHRGWISVVHTLCSPALPRFEQVGTGGDSARRAQPLSLLIPPSFVKGRGRRPVGRTGEGFPSTPPPDCSGALSPSRSRSRGGWQSFLSAPP